MTIIFNKPTITAAEYFSLESPDLDYKVTCPVLGCAADVAGHISDDIVVHSTDVTRLRYVRFSAEYDTELGLWAAVVDAEGEGLVHENLVDFHAELDQVDKAIANLNEYRTPLEAASA